MDRKAAGDLLWENLKELPAFRALIRAIEARLLLSLGPLPGPILDVGCGDGHFGELVLKKADAGLDLELASLATARKRGVYRILSYASATAIPYRTGTFSTVLANCALEHMPDVDSVFREVARVLAPGGRFLFTVPNDVHNDHLLVARALEGAGLKGLAGTYRGWFRTIQRHFHMLSQAGWSAKAEAQGLKVTRCTPYLSPLATVYLELGHYTGAPRVLYHALTGKWVLFPWRPRFAPVEALLMPRVVEDGVPRSSCFLFVAEKP